MEFMLSVSACSLLIRRERGITRAFSAQNFLVPAILIMFTNSTLLFTSTLLSDIVQVKALTLNSGYNPIPVLTEWGVIEVVVSRITYLFSDAIVVWRAWILFEGHIQFRYFLGVCFLVSFASIVIDLAFAIKENLEDALVNPSFTSIRLLLPIALLFTNILTTLIVARRRWQYKQFVEKNHERTGRSRADNILVILIKSGVIYCGIWILFLIFSGRSQPLSEPEFYLGLYIPHLTSMYPTTIILMTALGKNEWTSQNMPDANANGSISQSLQFASGPHGARSSTGFGTGR
ncbi:hypothetical protein D9757_011915 [Collybiopsis confluens]|uniref:Uncharacterized protein n=1 Tax=Collybiopsis confluens TaxID=2823264 RepID=A0A8H5LP50_9AGAR|nr:hypothetical protein D9757_011915 [Collybiopsis confluens]